MAEYGYCRISKPKQSITRQIRNIAAAYPQAKIIEEAYTGTTTDRPQWNRLRRLLKAGDVLIFDSVSRMSRNAEEGYELYRELIGEGIELHFLKEPYIDSTVYQNAVQRSIPMTGTAVDLILKGVNEYMLVLAQEQIRVAFEQAEKEVMDLRERTREGLVTAKAQGKQIGRAAGAKVETTKAVRCKEIIRTHSKSFGGSLNDSECIQLCGCSRNSFYAYKRQVRGE